MTPQWNFIKPKPGDKNREPILGEFFATEAITNPAEALVREGDQNSLDAGEGGLVRVRIYISGATGAVPATVVAPYFASAWPHIHAQGNGLHDAPTSDEPCPFLTFEDFGTSGLTGDVMQWHERPGVDNPFYYFFRAEGQSGKGEQDRGRWGVGKTVFPRSSRVSAYFGLTVRADDGKRLLMGQSVLKSHFVGDDYFSPDGYFGLQDTSGLTLPIENRETVERFCTEFRLQRQTEPGLSIVVPWCEAEINETAVISAVCRDYFYPILAAKLEVTVATPSAETVINNESLVSVAQRIAGHLSVELPALLELAEWATEMRPNERLTIGKPPQDGALRWGPELFSEEHVTKVRAALQAGERIALRVPVTVREKNKEPRESFFDVFMVADPKAERGQTVFVREGIIISDVRAPRSRGILSLVVVENDALATLLGDSENPAHTQWQQDSSNYKGKYVYGPSYIQFVKKSVSEIVQIVTKSDDEIDKTLLMDLFYLPIEKEIPSIEETTETEDEIEPPPPPKSAVFRVRKVKGGFTVSNAQANGSLPAFFEVRVAYDVRRGSPLRKYNPADFDLEKLPITSNGIEIKSKKLNSILAQIVQPKFELTVNGFDEHRDLIVRITGKQDLDASEN